MDGLSYGTLAVPRATLLARASGPSSLETDMDFPRRAVRPHAPGSGRAACKQAEVPVTRVRSICNDPTRYRGWGSTMGAARIYLNRAAVGRDGEAPSLMTSDGASVTWCELPRLDSNQRQVG